MSGQIGFCFCQDRCIGCATCQIACKEKNNLPPGQWFRKVQEIAGGGYTQDGQGVENNVYAYWLSMACNHCREPLCSSSCPTGAIVKRPEDGIVLIDEDKCIGCRQCIGACPYGALQYNSELQKVSKCDFCAGLLAQGEQPACIAACPMRALQHGLVEDLEKENGVIFRLKGMPDAEITKPSMIISPHKDSERNFPNKRDAGR